MIQPQAGDIAYFVRQTEGGDPFRVVVCYFYSQRWGKMGWYNTEGITTEPLSDGHPGLQQLRLLVHDGHPAKGRVAQYNITRPLDNASTI